MIFIYIIVYMILYLETSLTVCGGRSETYTTAAGNAKTAGQNQSCNVNKTIRLGFFWI